MRLIEAPNYEQFDDGEIKLFLAGGITGCPDWQKIIIAALSDLDLTILNPRRANFPIHNPDVVLEQITWEYRMLRAADIISFWFPQQTICPIVLYELGAWSMTDKPICVGAWFDYPRIQDVEIQTRLQRPEVTVVHHLSALAEEIDDTYTKMRQELT